MNDYEIKESYASYKEILKQFTVAELLSYGDQESYQGKSKSKLSNPSINCNVLSFMTSY